MNEISQAGCIGTKEKSGETGTNGAGDTGSILRGRVDPKFNQ